jgi:hypothetical protein
MKANIFNRLIGKFEKDINWIGKQRIKEYFGSCNRIEVKRNDTENTKKLISRHNDLAAEYNRKGEELAKLLILKMDQVLPHPQDDWLGCIDELIKSRRLNKNDAVVFRSVNNRLHNLNQRMQNTYYGSGGIGELRKKIRESRSV